jgi:hypothetical protein
MDIGRRGKVWGSIGLFVQKLLKSSTRRHWKGTRGETAKGDVSVFGLSELMSNLLLTLMSLYCTYRGGGRYGLETDDRNYTAMARQEPGEKWSLFLKILLTAAFCSFT